MRYQHKQETHNLRSPEVIVPILNDLIHPQNVIDIGCGVGTFLYVFKRLGVKEVMGLDGKWANKNLVAKYLESNEFRETNLSNVIPLDKKYDLAICLEVAEHIREEDSENIVKTLVNASDSIAFSAAPPYQRGQHHINEQWPDYWKEKFSKYEYYFHDVLRPTLWNNPVVDFWYKQNIFLVLHKDKTPDETTINKLKLNTFDHIIHPDAFSKRSALYLKILEGKMSIYFYVKLLIKRILFLLGIQLKSNNYT